MTLEEKAIKHCDEVICSVCKNRTCTDSIKCAEWRWRRAGYYCGAEENGIEWHKLRDNPKDLPERGKEVRVAYHPFLPICQDEDEFEECNGVYKTDEPLWLIDDHVYPTDDVIAWCELPKFNIKE